jgi:hypothetical protein
MRSINVFTVTVAAVLGLSVMPAFSKDLNEASRGGGRSVEFFDQINKASIVMLDEGKLIPHPMAARIADGIEQIIAPKNLPTIWNTNRN